MYSTSGGFESAYFTLGMGEAHPNPPGSGSQGRSFRLGVRFGTAAASQPRILAPSSAFLGRCSEVSLASSMEPAAIFGSEGMPTLSLRGVAAFHR